MNKLTTALITGLFASSVYAQATDPVPPTPSTAASSGASTSVGTHAGGIDAKTSAEIEKADAKAAEKSAKADAKADKKIAKAQAKANKDKAKANAEAKEDKADALK